MKNEVLVHEDWSQYDCSSACFPVQGTNIGDQYHLKREMWRLASPRRTRSWRATSPAGCCSTPPLKPILPPRRRIPSLGRSTSGARSVPLQQPGVDRQDLSCAMEKVRLTVTEIGGGFAASMRPSASIAVALSLKAKGRPVKLTYGRDEEFAQLCAAPRSHIHMKTGVKRDGTLTAQKVDIQWDAGAYVTTNPRVDYNAGFAANGPYNDP